MANRSERREAIYRKVCSQRCLKGMEGCGQASGVNCPKRAGWSGAERASRVASAPALSADSPTQGWRSWTCSWATDCRNTAKGRRVASCSRSTSPRGNFATYRLIYPFDSHVKRPKSRNFPRVFEFSSPRSYDFDSSNWNTKRSRSHWTVVPHELSAPTHIRYHFSYNFSSTFPILSFEPGRTMREWTAKVRKIRGKVFKIKKLGDARGSMVNRPLHPGKAALEIYI